MSTSFGSTFFPFQFNLSPSVFPSERGMPLTSSRYRNGRTSLLEARLVQDGRDYLRWQEARRHCRLLPTIACLFSQCQINWRPTVSDDDAHSMSVGLSNLGKLYARLKAFNFSITEHSSPRAQVNVSTIVYFNYVCMYYFLMCIMYVCKGWWHNRIYEKIWMMKTNLLLFKLTNGIISESEFIQF